MCFRPAVAEEPMMCPECGEQINSVMGTLPHICPWCDADIEEAVLAFQAEQQNKSTEAAEAPTAAPSIPAAPASAAAPSAPAAPAAPKM